MRRINLGAGGVRFPGWVHLDIKPEPPGLYPPGEYVQCDAREGLVFDAGTVDTVFCEHFLEHLDLQEALAVARNVHRALRPGGGWRIAVPDAIYRPEPEPIGPFGHKTQWCVELLIRLLDQAGFGEVFVLRAWTRHGERIHRPVPDAELRGEISRADSLVVDAVK